MESCLMKLKKSTGCDYLLFDMTNLLYRTFFANRSEDDVTVAGMAHHMALMTLNKYFKQFKPRKRVIMCFDRSSWRKEYTKSEKCISEKVYKGTRRKDMSPAQQEKFENFIDHIGEFREIMRDHTSAVVLDALRLEADDLIAGACDVLALDDNAEIYIISADQDMLQCLKHSNVHLINPANGKPRTLDDWDGDADLFMFEKCIRGDRGDNVQSAYPRCKKTKILRAYNDPLECANMMHETWIRPETPSMPEKEFVVKQLFKENELLMDLSKQPEDIYRMVIKTVLEGLENPGVYSHFHFLKFLGKYEMKKVAASLDLFVPMLSR